MKTKLMYPLLLIVLYAFAGALTASAQFAHIRGKVTDKGQPLAGVQVIYKSANTGKIVKVKTDSKGEFFSIGVPDDVYNVSVIDASGKTIYTHDKITVAQGGDDVDNILNIDLTNGVTVKTPGGASAGGAGGQLSEFQGDNVNAKEAATGTKREGPSVTKEEVERLTKEHDKGMNLNALIVEYNTAQQAKNWQKAADLLKQMIAVDPNRWDYQKALGDMQFNLGQYDEAVATYEKAAPLADAAKVDPKADQTKMKVTLAQLYANEGNSYLKLKKNPEAVAAFTKAAELDPNPGTAYFNLCATQYNTGNTEGALAACDKAIAADPKKADAYFIKGSLLLGSSSLDKQGKLQAPPGTAEALNKYLEIDPSGGHAADVKEMLAAIGAKITTSYNEKVKKK
jgi:tetratricopeptide (TPR) repeat protein